MLKPEIALKIREDRQDLLKKVASIVEPFYESLRASRPPSVERVGSLHSPLVMQIVSDIIGFEDTSLAWDVFWGIQITGVVRRCGSMKWNKQRDQ